MKVGSRWIPGGLLVLLGFLTAQEVPAWGDTGHRIICEIAFQELTPQARAAVTQLLQRDPVWSAKMSSRCPLFKPVLMMQTAKDGTGDHT